MPKSPPGCKSTARLWTRQLSDFAVWALRGLCYCDGVSSLIAGLLGALVATNPLSTVSNLVLQTPGVAMTIADRNDPVEEEFQKLMDQDDEAQAEVDQWIRENGDYAAKGAAMPPVLFKQRIEKRLEPVNKAYEAFLQRHPDHVRARVAYASFLGDVKGEDAAQEQLEKALALDTNNAAIYNNLANIYGHLGPVKKAFEYYAKAIQINPTEALYYHNFGTTVYLFRTDAKEFYGIDEQAVFAKAFGLYSNALRLDPENFPLASDVAQSYYSVRPLPTDEALNAWTNALRIAHDEIEREGVYVHLARVNILADRLAVARAHLNAITNDMYADLKKRLTRNLVERESGTNTPSALPPAREEKEPKNTSPASRTN
jgi:tetratricopeptide (TPR) repeat protein